MLKNYQNLPALASLDFKTSLATIAFLVATNFLPRWGEVFSVSFVQTLSTLLILLLVIYLIGFTSIYLAEYKQYLRMYLAIGTIVLGTIMHIVPSIRDEYLLFDFEIASIVGIALIFYMAIHVLLAGYYSTKVARSLESAK